LGPGAVRPRNTSLQKPQSIRHVTVSHLASVTKQRQFVERWSTFTVCVSVDV